MFTHVSFNQFVDEFTRMGRKDQYVDEVRSRTPGNFSYEGLRALFDYLEEYEEYTGTPIELDVVALCCEFTEYEDAYDFGKNFGDCSDLLENAPEDSDDWEADIMEALAERTTIIRIPQSDGFILENF